MPESFWVRNANGRRRRFRELINDPRRQDVFNDKFFEAMADGRKTIKSRAQRVQIVQSTIALLLICSLLLPTVHLSFLGVGVEAAYLREGLLLISASIVSANFLGIGDEIYNRELIETYVRKVGGDDEELKRILRLRYGLSVGTQIPTIAGNELTGANILLFLIAGIAFVVWVSLFFVGLITVHVAAIVSILRHPSVSLTSECFAHHLCSVS